MIPRFGEPMKTGQRARPRPGAYAVLWRDGRVLLTLQSEPVPEFQLPGGGIDPGESPMQALHREVLEETGWRIAPLRRLGAFRRFTLSHDTGTWSEKVCAVYLARPVRRLGAPRETGHFAVWMLPDVAMAALANQGERYFLTQVVT